jgi:hypothetical protein
MYVIYVSKRPLSTSEIVDDLLENYQPEDIAKRPNWIGSISSVLGTSAKKGKLLKGKNVLGDFIYGLPENFSPKKEFANEAVSGFNFV